MTVTKSIAGYFMFFLLLFNFHVAFACSTYKVTVNGKTMVGSNYDTWLETPRIWFETNGYGVAFTGARSDGKNGFAPQTGMNEFGLAFVTLATATPENGMVPLGKKQIVSRTNYLKDILHTCKTVDDVKMYIDQYDHSSLNNDVFLYVDSTGRYLVVEPYDLTLGDDTSYVLANFCPSTIADFSTIKQTRYVNGTAFLKNKIDSTLAFCSALSDTMHVCRKKLGDGTLLTSVLDLKEKITYLYFYHDYTHCVQFNMKEELKKGEHFVEITSLFPPNAEFQKLVAFKTPANSKAINKFIQFCVALFFFSAFFFLIRFAIKRKNTPHPYFNLLLVLLSFVLVFYMFVLVREENIYYFPAPYTDGSFSPVSMASYIPFLVLLLILPLLFLNVKLFRKSTWGAIPTCILTLNNCTYLALIVLFSYWGFYNILD